LVGTHDQFADPARRHLAVVLVDDADRDARPHASARSARRRIVFRSDRAGDLAHVEDRIHVEPEALAYEPSVLAKRQYHHPAQSVIATESLELAQQERRHRAEQAGGCGFELLACFEERIRAELAENRDRSATSERAGHEERASDME
jgi:hypothetical protein